MEEQLVLIQTEQLNLNLVEPHHHGLAGELVQVELNLELVLKQLVVELQLVQLVDIVQEQIVDLVEHQEFVQGHIIVVIQEQV
jgi:hypothetical protein